MWNSGYGLPAGKCINGCSKLKNPALTLDMLIARAGVNRCYLSGTLNRCSRKNFSTYINEYRMKEAIRLMSEPSDENLTIEALAYEAGFNDRSNFYRIFKKNDRSFTDRFPQKYQPEIIFFHRAEVSTKGRKSEKICCNISFATIVFL